MSILRLLMTLTIVSILSCANAVPIYQDASVAQAIDSAREALSERSYTLALNHLRTAKTAATLEHVALPSMVGELRHFATKRRLAEIEYEIVSAYHRINVELTLALADEAILIAKEDDAKVPAEILRIKSRTERHYFEPVFYGIPPHLTFRKIII